MKSVKAICMIKLNNNLKVVNCNSITELANYFKISKSYMGKLIKNKRNFRGFMCKLEGKKK